jgi:hypothetical protein
MPTEEHDSSLEDNKNNEQKRVDENVSVSGSGSQGGSKQIEWSPENEVIMVEWCDVAQCYKWLNSRAHTRLSYMNAWFTIPAIVLSTISGTASFAQTSLPIAYQVYAPMAIGTINIAVGILTTVQQYLKISELNEAHRVSSISWDKFARNIRIELAKKPEERMDAGHFIKINRQEFDRLMETSPTVNDKVIKEFNEKFRGKAGTEQRKRFDELKKPDICDTIVSANETRHQWYLEANKPVESFDLGIDESELKSKDDIIKMQQKKIIEKEMELKRKKKEEQDKEKNFIQQQEILMSQKIESEQDYLDKIIPLKEYVSTFEDMFARKPLRDEIYDNNTGNVDENSLIRFLNEFENQTIVDSNNDDNKQQLFYFLDCVFLDFLFIFLDFLFVFRVFLIKFFIRFPPKDPGYFEL